jgi:hypothetical protein
MKTMVGLPFLISKASISPATIVARLAGFFSLTNVVNTIHNKTYMIS